MSIERYQLVFIISFVVMGGFVIWFFVRSYIPATETSVSSSVSTSTSETLGLPASDIGSSLLKTTPGIERRYVNDALRFSFVLPDGFTAVDQPMNAPATHSVIVVNQSGDGFLVIAQPLAEGSASLTAAQIQPNAEGETITNIQNTTIRGGISGFAFDTNNVLWKGDGKGVWFTHNGYLYRIETYTKDLPLLDFVRVTWSWQ